MSIGSLRPTFELQLPISCDSADKYIRDLLSQPEWCDNSFAFDRYAELHVPAQELRIWSPHLSLHLTPLEEGTHVFARFAPRQNVWTFVWVVYLALTFTAFFAAIFGYSLWLIQQPFWWTMLIAMVSLAGIGILHLVSRVGQGLSSDQMHWLHGRSDRLFQVVLDRARASESERTD